jgi:hypothetical protein
MVGCLCFVAIDEGSGDRFFCEVLSVDAEDLDLVER